MKCFLSLSGSSLSLTHIPIQEYLESLKPHLVRFQDELLSSALSMIFNMPLHVIDVNYIIDCAAIALKTGIEAESAVNALHRCFVDEVEQPQLRCRLHNILPLLSTYVCSSSVVGNKSEDEMKLTPRNRKSQSTTIEKGEKLQFTILRFLGRLGGLNQGMLEQPNNVIKSITSWNFNECLALDLPLPNSNDMRRVSKLKLVLDRLIPRILELCKGVSSEMTTNERQLRILAAETLHGIILLMIGLAATKPNKKEKSVFEPTYQKIFPVAISLSTCPDMFCRKLFSRLLFQMIHWFSGQQAHPGILNFHYFL